MTRQHNFSGRNRLIVVPSKCWLPGIALIADGYGACQSRNFPSGDSAADTGVPVPMNTNYNSPASFATASSTDARCL